MITKRRTQGARRSRWAAGPRETGRAAMKASVQRVVDTLQTLGVEAEITEFSESTRTAEEAARAVGATVGQIVKSLVFVAADGAPLLALASGAHRGDVKKLAAAVGGAVARGDP